MRKCSGFVFGIVVLLSLFGCVQVDTVLRVKPDGSGTIEEKVLMSRAIVEQMQAIASGFSIEGETKTEGKQSFDMFDEEQVRGRASSYGEGVTYVSGKKVDTENAQGYQATYAFKDVSKLTLDQNPGGKVPAPVPGESSEKDEEFVTFQFTKGNLSELIIKMPAKKFPEESSAEGTGTAGIEEGGFASGAQAGGEMAAQMMKQMFEGMKLTMAVEVEGSIAETNATHREGSKVTLMEIDFGKIVANAEKFQKLAVANPKSLEEAKALMKDIEGIKVELEDEVVIKFQ